MSTHQELAVQALQLAREAHGPTVEPDFEDVAFHLAAAQVEAALALAEQQRLANLLTLALHEARDGRHRKGAFFAVFTNPTDEFSGYGLRSDVREALGLPA